MASFKMRSVCFACLLSLQSELPPVAVGQPPFERASEMINKTTAMKSSRVEWIGGQIMQQEQRVPSFRLHFQLQIDFDGAGGFSHFGRTGPTVPGRTCVWLCSLFRCLRNISSHLSVELKAAISSVVLSSDPMTARYFRHIS